MMRAPFFALCCTPPNYDGSPAFEEYDMKRRGFSLIELLVTVLITSIVVIAAYQLLTSTTGSFGDEDSRRILESNLRNAELLLQRDIARAGYAYGYVADNATGVRQIGSVCRAGFIGSGPLKQVAFMHRRDGNFSSLQIIASISDYDDFTVSSCTGTSVVLDRSVTLPLIAGQVFQGDLNTKTSDDGTFQSIFSRMFRGASAIEISTPDSGTAIALIDDLGNTELNSGNTLALKNTNCANLSNYCSIDPERPLAENTINPIISVIYRVNGDNLERCVARVDAPDFDVSDAACDVLLSGVVYFDVYPLVGNMAFSDMAIPDTPFQGNEWNNVKIKELQGAMFRLGATVRSASMRNIQNAPENEYSALYKQFADRDGIYLLSHARGVALFQSPKDETISETDGNLSVVPATAH